MCSDIIEILTIQVTEVEIEQRYKDASKIIYLFSIHICKKLLTVQTFLVKLCSKFSLNIF